MQKMIGNGFSATIKDGNLRAESVVSHKEKSIHHFYDSIYWNSDDSEPTGLVYKWPKVEHGLRRVVCLRGASCWVCSPMQVPPWCWACETRDRSEQPSFVAYHYKRLEGNTLASWQADRPSSASWQSGHRLEAIDGAAGWWKATCQRSVYDVNSQALPWLELNFVLLYSIYFVESAS